MARVAVNAHGSERLGGCSGAQDALRLGGSNGTRALDTVKLRTLIAETASCGGVMLENMWQTGPILLTPRRDFVVAVRDCFLYDIRCTRSAVLVQGDRAVFLRLCR